MNMLLTGSQGQVGWELARSLLPIAGDILKPTRSELDLADHQALRSYLERHRPSMIINPAAYTAVDQAEKEPEIALRINAEAPEIMAEYARKHQALLIHYSTDYVFDGDKAEPYQETDAANPIGVYGHSKWQGEQAIINSGCDYLILRTSWVYAARGRNFLLTILRLAFEREQLNVVSDQFGAPTWARLIADCTCLILQQAQQQRHSQSFNSGLYHLTCQNATSWHGFAQAIIDQARPLSAASIKTSAIHAIATAEYPTPAKRPANSRLDCSQLSQHFGLTLPHWQDTLHLCLEDYFRN